MAEKTFKEPVISIDMKAVFNNTDYLLYQTVDNHWVLLVGKKNAAVFGLPKSTRQKLSEQFLGYMISDATQKGIQNAFIVSYPGESLGEFLCRTGFVKLKV